MYVNLCVVPGEYDLCKYVEKNKKYVYDTIYMICAIICK